MVVLSDSHMTNWFGTVMRLAHSDPGRFFGIPWMRTNISRLWPGVTTETEQKPTWESQQESIYPSYPPAIKHGLREHLGRWRSKIFPLKPPFTGFLHCHVWLSKGTIPGLVTTCPNKGLPISSTCPNKGPWVYHLYSSWPFGAMTNSQASCHHYPCTRFSEAEATTPKEQWPKNVVIVVAVSWRFWYVLISLQFTWFTLIMGKLSRITLW